MTIQRTWLLSPALLLALAAPALLTHCASHTASGDHAGSASPESPARLYVYDLNRPTVDAQYAAQVAARFGITGEPKSLDTFWSVSAAHRVVTVHKGTGGFRYFDYTKYDSPKYAVDPSSLGEAEVRVLATEYLRETAMLPDDATLGSVRLESGRGNQPNHWAVTYSFTLPAGVTSDGLTVNASLKGAVVTVYVGAGEVIGVERDYPSLTRRSETLADETGALALAQSHVESVVGLVDLAYWYGAFSDNQPHLDPEGVYAPLGGASLTVKPVTSFRPTFASADEAGEGTSKVAPSFIAGEIADVVAPEVRGGTAPYVYRWDAVIPGAGNKTLSTDRVLRAGLPTNAAGLTVNVIDANGMTASTPFIVTLAPGAPVPVAPPHSRSFAPDMLVKNPGPVRPIYNYEWTVLSGSNTPWTADYGEEGPTGGGGLTLANIEIGGRLVADMWSMPTITLSTKSMPTPQTIHFGQTAAVAPGTGVKRILNECWNGSTTTYSDLDLFEPTPVPCYTATDPAHPLPWALSAGNIPLDLWGISRNPLNGQAYFNRPFNDQSLVARSVYAWTPTPTAACTLVVAQTYIMEPLVNPGLASANQACGSADANMCARYYPVVQYYYQKTSALADPCETDTIVSVTVEQKFEQDLYSGAVPSATQPMSPYPFTGSNAVNTTGDISLFINDTSDVWSPLSPFGGSLPYQSFDPITQEQTATMARSAPANTPNYLASCVNSGSLKTEDNFHEKHDQSVIFVPGCYASAAQPDLPTE